MNKFDIDTPCLVIEKKILVENLKLMQSHVDSAAKHLRPHTKTHKCSSLAKLQMKMGAYGLCATKISEALVLAKAGLNKILVTSPVVTRQKLTKLVECHKLDSDLTVVCDSINNAETLNCIMRNEKTKLNVLVDVDSGIGRTGISGKQALELGRYIDSCSYLNLLGIQCYAGHLQHVSDFSERKISSDEVMLKASKLKEEFLKNNIPCSILSGSGTGTYLSDLNIDEVTEVQPGSYSVMDMEYQSIGSADDRDKFEDFKPAMTMLVTVISANQDTHVTVDAGTKAIYFDVNTKPKIISHKGLHYDWSGFGDEHGKITADEGVKLPKVGDVLEMIVPHCDPTINLYNKLYIIDNGVLVDCWDIDMRGCVE